MNILKNAVWLGAARGGADIASFALFTGISRVYGPAGVGEYCYAFAIGNLVALIGCSGLEEYGVREYAAAVSGARLELWRNLMSAQVRQLGIAAIFLCLFLLSGINTTARTSVILESTVYFVGWYLSRTLFVPAMAAQAMRLPAISDLTCRLFATLSALGLALGLAISVPRLLVFFPVAGLAMAAIAFVSARRRAGQPRFDSPRAAVQSTLKETMTFAATELLNQFYARADLLLIATWLTTAAVGWYAVGIKLVEVGLLPMVMLGTAVYPAISGLAGARTALLAQTVREFVFLIAFLSGWLAIGIATLGPVCIGPLFGADFRPVIDLLPWFAVFALIKGAEVAIYRLLFCFRRQSWYAACLGVGTAVIVTMNVFLIPRFGLRGALAAAIVSTLIVDGACLYELRRFVGLTVFSSASWRALLAACLTVVIFLEAAHLDVSPAFRAVLACLTYPLVGWGLGLLPRPHGGTLFSHSSKETGPAPFPATVLGAHASPAATLCVVKDGSAT